MARSDDYITQVRDANRKVWEGINTLVGLQREWTAADYGTTLPPGSGANEGIFSEDISDVVFTTANALVELLQTGHATNMTKLL